jgi:hypothetical protein
LGKSYGRTSLPLAFIGRFHERKNLYGLLRFYGGDTRLEEFHDFGEQGFVAIKRSDGALTRCSFGEAMKFFVFAEDAFATVAPITNDFDMPVGGVGPLHSLTTRAQDCAEGLYPMHTVPEKVSVVRLDFARAVSFGVKHVANRTMGYGLGIAGEAERRGGEHRHFLALCQTKELDNVLE